MKTMTPGEETRSLRKFPLPSEVINLTEDDNLLPSRIYHIDRRIEDLQTLVKEQQELRETLMKRALFNDILEDDNCRIDFKERHSRDLDEVKFRDKYPKEYEQIRRRMIEDATKSIDSRNISLTIADGIVGKTNVDEFCEITITSVPFVVPKRLAPRGEGV